MSPRIKKLIGTILILLWIPVYAFFAMGVAAHVLPRAGGLAAFLFYAIAGTLWAVPVGMLFPWMMREPKPKP
ncbi:MAG TPA: DUF2842 domain-containing protein [Rhizomicrobium sp.]